ncbi:MAG: patatin-like phospholipase family protein [Desulfobulbaceae bacterium]|jgi:NTE family protein|nr:patatin-like phospholipase family protein [Desulfobulbaceae bacterium]MDH3866522.1 patatin-like phospholipase family protein [Desulfobulbaceae bacterium]PLX52483.1 MAG: patatin [Desulfobulbaceae bacterium]
MLKGNRIGRIMVLGTSCFMLLIFSGCAHYAIDDKPLAQWSPASNKEIGRMVAGNRSSEVLVLVAFSGGGTRAASFAYGVLQELAETEVMTAKGSRTLLNEIDIISSVSGGSFTSSYYGLYGDRIFEDFEERFLRQDVQGKLLWKLARPVNWFRLASGAYGKADMAAEYYNKILFDSATFADMLRPDTPMVVINSTDLATGTRVGFTQLFFDALCLDLRSYSVSRAVTASSAVPGLFSPITLENFSGSCGFEPPDWIGDALKDEDSTNRKAHAQDIKAYLDREKRPWLFLVDGGVADNLGLRAFYELFELQGDLQNTLRSINHADVKQILMIAVDSHTKPNSPWALKRLNPSLPQVLGSVSAVQIGRYSRDTMEIVNNGFYKWTDELNKAGHPVTFDFVEVSFANVQNEDDRTRLFEIGTSFSLSNEEVDLLIASARQVLRQSFAFQDFLNENKELMGR